MSDNASEKEPNIDPNERDRSCRAGSYLAKARRYRKLGNHAQSLADAMTSIENSIELMCLRLDMDFEPERGWLAGLVEAIPSQSKDEDMARRFTTIAGSLFRHIE